MYDGELAERGGDEAEGAGEGRENVAGDFAAERGEEERLADEGDAATDHHHLRGDEGDDLRDGPAEHLAGVVHHLAGDFVPFGRGLGDSFGGEVVRIAAAAGEQVGDVFLFGPLLIGETGADFVFEGAANSWRTRNIRGLTPPARRLTPLQILPQRIQRPRNLPGNPGSSGGGDGRARAEGFHGQFWAVFVQARAEMADFPSFPMRKVRNGPHRQV